MGWAAGDARTRHQPHHFHTGPRLPFSNVIGDLDANEHRIGTLRSERRSQLTHNPTLKPIGDKFRHTFRTGTRHGTHAGLLKVGVLGMEQNSGAIRVLRPTQQSASRGMCPAATITVRKDNPDEAK